MALLLGIDLGTTHCKVAAYTPEGRLVALSRGRTPTERPMPGWAEHPPDRLWSVIREGIRDVLAQVPDQRGAVKGVGVAGMAEAGLLIDRNGEPLTPIHAWYDQRAQEYVPRWERGGEPGELFRTTGIEPSTKCPLIKLEWLRDHRSKAFESAWKWLHMPDYIVFLLTGEAGTDYSLAGRTLAFDIHRRRWCEWILTWAKVDSRLWPKAQLASQPVGVVTQNASELTGLPPGIPVVVAGHDHVCGAAGVGAFDQGAVVDSVGTAESVIGIVDRLSAAGMRGDGYHYGCHVTGDAYYVMAGFSGSGASVEWWMNQFGAPSEDRYQWLLDLLDQCRPGPTGILHLPYLRGSGPPAKEPADGAVWVGITESAAKEESMKAVLEGLACEFRRMLEDLPAPPAVVSVIGGGAQNPHWLRLKATVTGRTLFVPDAEEAVTQGAAILAGTAAGIYDSPKVGAGAMMGDQKTIEPDPDHMEAYDLWYRTVYLLAYQRLREVQRAMRQFQGGRHP